MTFKLINDKMCMIKVTCLKYLYNALRLGRKCVTRPNRRNQTRSRHLDRIQERPAKQVYDQLQ